MRELALPILYRRLGLVPYREAIVAQERLVRARLSGAASDHALFLEHPAVITQGQRECADDYLTPPAAIAAEGIELVKTSRGGRLTYHGPGQLIGYFICDMARFGGVRAFVRAIESTLIALCASWGIEARRDERHPGVWVRDRKIAAIGLHVSKGISSHGFALNVDCDLAPYRHIVACGIHDRGVTSLSQECNTQIRVADATEIFLSLAPHTFGCEFAEPLSDGDGLVGIGSDEGESRR